MKLFYPEIDLMDGNNVVDFEKWFELLNPSLTAIVASTFYDDMPAIDVYNPMYIEWLGELVNKYREQCFLLKYKIGETYENSERSC